MAAIQKNIGYFNIWSMSILAGLVLLCLVIPVFFEHPLTVWALVPSYIVAAGLAGFTALRIKVPGADIALGESRTVQESGAPALQKAMLGLLVVAVVMLGLLVWRAFF